MAFIVTIGKKINALLLLCIERYPAWTYLTINKILWTIGFFYSIWVIQGSVPSFRQWILGAIFAVLTLPLGYWINTLFFQVKNKKE